MIVVNTHTERTKNNYFWEFEDIGRMVSVYGRARRMMWKINVYIHSHCIYYRKFWQDSIWLSESDATAVL